MTVLVHRHARRDYDSRRLVVAAMNLFFALTIGTMAFGHLLAITTKLVVGTLQAAAPLLYAIGLVLAVPSWVLVRHAYRRFVSAPASDTAAIALNAWLAATLLALGPHNLPLAAPAVFNIAYLRHSRPLVGRAVLGLAVVLNLALFAGSLAFLASGQSFEQFRAVE